MKRCCAQDVSIELFRRGALPMLKCGINRKLLFFVGWGFRQFPPGAQVPLPNAVGRLEILKVHLRLRAVCIPVTSTLDRVLEFCYVGLGAFRLLGLGE